MSTKKTNVSKMKFNFLKILSALKKSIDRVNENSKNNV